MKFAVFVLVALICCSPLLGSDLSVVVGAAPSGDLKTPELSLDIDSYSLFGVRFEKTFALIIGFENSLLFANNVLNPVGEPGDNGLYTSSNILFNMPVSEKAVPYLTFGLGILYKFGDSFPDVGSTFHTNWGGGLKLRELAGPVGVRLDYRRYRFHGVEGESVGAHEISGGVLFSF